MFAKAGPRGQPVIISLQMRQLPAHETNVVFAIKNAVKLGIGNGTTLVNKKGTL